MPDKLYRSHSLEKSGDTISGSLTIWEDNPVSPFDVGDTFTPVQGCPLLTVEKVNIKDNVIGERNGKPLRQWEITIEGSNGVSASSGSQTHVKYNFTISEDEKTGTMEVVNKGSSPSITISVGSKFSVPGVGQVTCTNVKGSDSYDDNDVHTWTVTYEGSTKISGEDNENFDKYSVSVEKTLDGVTIYSGSKEVTYTGTSPSLTSVGSSVSLPIIGSVTCTKSYATKIGANTWTITTEGSRKGDTSTDLPDTETIINYEINGVTLRSVAGGFIALRRSTTPITKKTITKYTDTVAAVTTPGNTYEGGTVISENISKETIKENGVVISTYYRHSIEVEA